VERQQLKWLVASVPLAGILFPVSFLSELSGLVDIASVAAVALIPGAIGLAVLRYRLYEIDRLVSRTLAWALVTGILVTVFALLVVGLQAVLAGLTQGQTLAVAASTLVAFALFQPLRARVQRAVDRRFNRTRVDTQRAIDGFGAHVRESIDLDDLNARLTAAITETVQPSRAGLWIRNVRRDTSSEIS
jgi:DNA integrity scanning protein DisA with diadenylate cyclase activity